jgi:HK97 gp10 family phage protein
METKMKLNGMKELEAALLALADEFGPKQGASAMRPALKAAIGPVEDTIRANTPRDKGTLADSTKTRIGKPTATMLKSSHFSKDTILAARTGWTWSGNSLWTQALAQEFGTRKQSGSATLRTSFDQHAAQMIRDFAKTLGPAIEKRARALHKKRIKG